MSTSIVVIMLLISIAAISGLAATHEQWKTFGRVGWIVSIMLLAIIAIRNSSDPTIDLSYMDRPGGIYHTKTKTQMGDDVFRCVTQHRAYVGGICIGANSGTWYLNLADIEATMKPTDRSLGHAESMPALHGQQ